MKKKIIWMLVSCLMVLSLVIASCGPKEEEEVKITEEGGQVVITKEKAEEEKVEKEKKEGLLPPEVPKYGGVITSVTTGDPMGFDPGVTNSVMCGTIYFTHDKLARGDWAKGPAGTGED